MLNHQGAVSRLANIRGIFLLQATAPNTEYTVLGTENEVGSTILLVVMHAKWRHALLFIAQDNSILMYTYRKAMPCRQISPKNKSVPLLRASL